MARNYSMMRLAEETLLTANEPLTSRELWELAVKLGLDQKLGSEGLTPWDSLSARLVVDTRDNPNCSVIRHPGRPAKYSLKDPKAVREIIDTVNRELSKNETCQEPEEIESKLGQDIAALERLAKYPYRERDLHQFLSWFAKYGLGAVLTKTIFHETSSKKSWNEWLHPDLAGFWFPFESYNPELLALSGNGLSIARFYSFEMKREITLANLRESFFQAVSNSSWANEGYLVGANIDESVLGELGRLSGSFGIGVIELLLDDPENSAILFPARRKDEIDWEGANKLAQENPDFRQFLTSARIDITNCKLHGSEYDKVPTIEDLKLQWEKWNVREQSVLR